MRYLLQSGDWMRKEKSALTRTIIPHTIGSSTYEGLSDLKYDDYIPIGTVSKKKSWSV